MDLPSDEVVRPRDALDVATLANYLRRFDRRRPVVALTVPPGEQDPVVDVAQVLEQVRGRADVVVIQRADLTWALAEQLGREAAVFGGACRVYPPGDDWLADPRRTPLHLAHTPAARSALPQRLSADLERQLQLAERPAAQSWRRSEAVSRQRRAVRVATPRPAAHHGGVVAPPGPPAPAPQGGPSPRSLGGAFPTRPALAGESSPGLPGPAPPAGPTPRPPGLVSAGGPLPGSPGLVPPAGPTPRPPGLVSAGGPLPRPPAPVPQGGPLPGPPAPASQGGPLPRPPGLAPPAGPRPRPPQGGPLPGPPKGGSPAGPSPRPPDPTPPPEEAPADFAGPGEVTLIDNLPAARRLSRYLRSRGRRYPVVVASRATGQSAAFPDTAELARELRGIAQVVEITRPNVAWELSSNLPADCQTYGGSSRVYPVGIDWLDRPQSLRLHLAYRMDERPVVTSRILSDALRQSAAQTYSSARPVAGSELVAGTVMGVRGGAAWVQLDNSQSQLDMAVIWPELVADEIPPERLFCKDMRVSGLMDPASRRIDVRPSRRLAAEALAGHQPGLTVPGRVVRVEPRSCRVELFPGQVVKLAAEDVAETPDLRFVLTVGETLPVLIVEREADGDQWLLSIKEAGEEVVPAPSLLPDGPPWLELSPPPEPAVAESQVAPWAGFDPGDLSKLVPADMDSATEIIGGLCRELVLAQQEAVKAGRERESARLELAGARTRQRASEQELAKTAAELAALRRGSLSGGETYFEDEAEQLDFEIRLAWAKRIPAAEKDRRPLADWSYSDHFFDTLRALQGIDRTKIVDVIVEVLTGLDAELRGRDLHQLRSGQGGDDPVRLGPNGETYWRVALQVGTASARRLHYMRRHDKGVELASVRLHDDLRT